MQKDPKQQELRTQLWPRLDLRPYGGFFEGLVTIKDPKSIEKAMVLLCFRSKIVSEKNMCFTEFSIKNNGKPLVLLRFRSKIARKNTGFIEFSLKGVEQPMVLLCFRFKMLKN